MTLWRTMALGKELFLSLELVSLESTSAWTLIVLATYRCLVEDDSTN
jgi:hypothetical protein